MTTREIWRDVPSVPTLAASSWGRIKVLPYTVPMPRGGERVYEGQPRVGDWAETRYIVVHRRKTYRVARLVCEAFHGPPPPGKPVCMHLDEDSRNNRPENLAWGTQKENLNAPGFLEYCRSRVGEDNPLIKGRRRQQQQQESITC